MPQMRMLLTCPVQARRRTAGELIEVDHKTARALVQLRIAEYEPAVETPIKYAVVLAEPIDQPRIKRAYKRKANA